MHQVEVMPMIDEFKGDSFLRFVQFTIIFSHPDLVLLSSIS